MPLGHRLTKAFYIRDVLKVAPEIIGKQLVIKSYDKSVKRLVITEVEAYRGPDDLACHASRGRTSRTEVMFHSGGKLYVYFIYGMYWMLNIVTGDENEPQAILIRGIEGYNGPGRLTKLLGIDRSFYGEDLTVSERIWIEDDGFRPEYKTGSRIGINYAGEYWKEVPWRYMINSPS
jgi:DNA-3-methyladenine glycosylase